MSLDHIIKDKSTDREEDMTKDNIDSEKVFWTLSAERVWRRVCHIKVVREDFIINHVLQMIKHSSKRL